MTKGTLLVQVIPFRRADAGIPGVIRAEREGERVERTRTYRNIISGGSWCRRHARAKR